MIQSIYNNLDDINYYNKQLSAALDNDFTYAAGLKYGHTISMHVARTPEQALEMIIPRVPSVNTTNDYGEQQWQHHEFVSVFLGEKISEYALHEGLYNVTAQIAKWMSNPNAPKTMDFTAHFDGANIGVSVDKNFDMYSSNAIRLVLEKESKDDRYMEKCPYGFKCKTAYPSSEEKYLTKIGHLDREKAVSYLVKAHFTPLQIATFHHELDEPHLNISYQFSSSYGNSVYITGRFKNGRELAIKIPDTGPLKITLRTPDKDATAKPLTLASIQKHLPNIYNVIDSIITERDKLIKEENIYEPIGKDTHIYLSLDAQIKQAAKELEIEENYKGLPANKLFTGSEPADD